MKTAVTEQALADAGKALFLHEMATYDTDATETEAAWLLDEEVRGFWIARATVVAEVLIP